VRAQVCQSKTTSVALLLRLSSSKQRYAFQKPEIIAAVHEHLEVISRKTEGEGVMCLIN
jgi:hypothetical protein